MCVSVFLLPVQPPRGEPSVSSWPSACHHLLTQLWPTPKSQQGERKKMFLVKINVSFCYPSKLWHWYWMSVRMGVCALPPFQRWAALFSCMYKMEPLQHGPPSSQPPSMSPKSCHASSGSSWNLWNSNSVETQGGVSNLSKPADWTRLTKDMKV